MDTQKSEKNSPPFNHKNTRLIGEQGERNAESYLVKQGFKLLERNFLCRHGEIDIIMQDGDCLVFVEVRQRKNTMYGSPLETINHNKQKKLRRTAQYYCLIKKLPDSQALRFDVVGIVAETQQNSIQWIPNAF